MANKFQVSGQILTITDTVTNKTLVKSPKADLFYYIEALESTIPSIKLYDISGANSSGGATTFSCLLSTAIDSSDVPFTVETFKTFADSNLGFKAASLETDPIYGASEAALFVSGDKAKLDTVTNKWGLQGNSGTNPATDFIGTTDAQPLIFKTDDTEALRIDEDGYTIFDVKNETPTNNNALRISDKNIVLKTDEGIEKEIFSPKNAINLNEAIANCVKDRVNGNVGSDYGIMFFGDSLAGYPTKWIGSSIYSMTATESNLGAVEFTATPFNSYNGTAGSSFIRLDGTANTFNLDINQQWVRYGQAEWMGGIASSESAGTWFEFIVGGVYPANRATTLYILTDTAGGNYNIQKTLDNGASWTTVVSDTSYSLTRGIKKHDFTAETSTTQRVGYRVVNVTGTIKSLPALFKYRDKNNIYGINAWSGGADFSKQVLIPQTRVDFILTDLNVKMVTSSHRFETANLTSFKSEINILDTWFNGKAIDVVYIGNAPLIDLITPANNTTINIPIKEFNNYLLQKCDEKGYIFFNTWNEIGGIEGVLKKNLEGDGIHIGGSYSLGMKLLNQLSLPNPLQISQYQENLFTKRIKVGQNNLKDTNPLFPIDLEYDLPIIRMKATNLTGSAPRIDMFSGFSGTIGNSYIEATVAELKMFASSVGGINSRFTIYTGGAERVRVNSIGDLAVGTTSQNASSRVQIDSTTKGFLPPRMTTTQKNAIVTPASGLMVYDTTLNKLCVFTTVWETMTSS